MKIFGKIDIETIERLADITSSRHLSEITVTDGTGSITVKGAMLPPPPPPAGQPQPVTPAGFANDPSSPSPAAARSEAIAKGNVIKSPIVGTFYSSPAPGKPAFVSIGDKVKKGDVVMIIESMKLMNEVKSEYSGIVRQILVRSGDSVEYDQPIMVIE
ncbi:MAG: acetyl-CoA carboxylase biotin carboxyl carrier protein [Oscillospiraceae bacterium]|nr:acetyl-CoA carboxylase biotin carboxyl carrier protein [Oscillospiraceae bacterium]